MGVVCSVVNLINDDAHDENTKKKGTKRKNKTKEKR